MVVLFPIRVVTSYVIKELHCITKVYAALRVLFACMINVNIRSLTYYSHMVDTMLSTCIFI